MLTEFLLEDQGDGWWHCPSPLRCRVLDGPAARVGRSERYWLVETDPLIEWHGDAHYIEVWGPDHPLCHPMEPTKYALVMSTGRPLMREDLGILDGSVPAGPVSPSPPPTGVADAQTDSGLWIKAMIKSA
jgi:hypothetical protein